MFIITNHHELGKGGDIPKDTPIEIPQTGLEITTNNKNIYNIFIIIFNLILLTFVIKKKEEH